VFSLELPNHWNFSFNFYLVVVVVMLSYIPLFPQLYLHMFAQRKKVLMNDSKKKSS
jgi:very-long-chain (3R)-3-hydroxyacyl-CoA dehydratase